METLLKNISVANENTYLTNYSSLRRAEVSRAPPIFMARVKFRKIFHKIEVQNWNNYFKMLSTQSY